MLKTLPILKKPIVYIPIIILFLLAVGINAFIYVYKSKESSTSTVSTVAPTPRPSPRPIPHGKKGFTVSQSDKTVPQFSKGSVDPYDPIKDSAQIVTISVKHEKPITKVTAMLKTDNTVLGSVPLDLISGTNTNGEWQGSIQITDSYLYTYILVLQAESQEGVKSTVEIALR